MLNPLVALYFLVFLLTTFAGLRQSLLLGLPRWLLGSQVVISALAAVGILCWALHLDSDILRGIWQVVAVLIVAGYTAFFILDVRLVLARLDPELPPRERIARILLGGAVTILILLPALAMNLEIAFVW